jgi:hypothetical protein
VHNCSEREMEDTSRALIPVPLGRNSLFAPALQCDRTLAVFVHGFRGKALSTWLSFPDFVDEFDGLRNVDLLFYGYASSPQRMQNMAINLRSQIDAVWEDPGNLGPEAAEALAARPTLIEKGRHAAWDRVLFVAHSLGAVVLRRALLDCHLDAAARYDDAHWSRHSGLCLFAPAHSGANLLRLIGETFLTVGIPVASVLKQIYPCLQDLEEGCEALIALREDYRNLAEGPRSRVNALAVILAENDRVVDPARFPGDPVAEQINGKGHMDVCKPSRECRVPVSKLSRIWAAARANVPRGSGTEA